ncbi:hypothetical protein J3F84DRAFT_371114 [Trichoderma pleuroticola]
MQGRRGWGGWFGSDVRRPCIEQCVLASQGRVSRHPAPHACPRTQDLAKVGFDGRPRPLLHHAARLAGGYGEGRGKKGQSMLSVRTTDGGTQRTHSIRAARITRSRAADLSSLAVVGDKGLAGALAALVCTPQNDSASLLCRSSTGDASAAATTSEL